MDNRRYDAYGNEFEVVESDFNLTQVDKKIHDKKFDTKATTFGRDAFKRFCKNKSSVVGAIIIGILVLLSIILPVVSPYNIDKDNPNIKEIKMLPKLFNYKPTGVLDDDIANNEYDWNTFWNGTQVITNAQYDPDVKLPYVQDPSTGLSVYYPAEVVKEIDYYGFHTNSATKGAYDGIYILKTVNLLGQSRKDYSELIIYQQLDYNSTENFTLDLKFAEGDLHLEDNFKEIGANAKGKYRVVVKYNNGSRELVIRDWSTTYEDLSVNISHLMVENNLTTIKNAQIYIELENLENGYAYLPIQSLELSTDDTTEIEVAKLGTYTKNDILRMMSLSNGKDGYDDAVQKFRYAKLEIGVFPINFWRTTAQASQIYNAYNYRCDFVLDTYEYTYGKKETLDVTATKMQEYVDKGWCTYEYSKNEDGTYTFQFERLSDECPVVDVKKVVFAEIVNENTNEVILSQQLTCDVIMYRFLGYDTMPKYLLGTDDRGFDIIVYSFNGLKTSFVLSIIVSAICLSFGLIWGSISGYFGGNVDLFMERFCEILGGVPSTVVITLVVLLMGDNLFTFGLALCMTGWLGIAGRTRTQFYRFKGREYILASRTLGSSDMRLIFRHILPNSLGTIVTSSVLSIPSVIFSEASLSYLGILKGSNSFGNILSNNQEFITSRPMLIVFPAIIISLIMISFNLFGNGLRDALNPSLKGSE